MADSEFFGLEMQAENAVDQMDWIEKITGVIASLLKVQAPEKVNIQDLLLLRKPVEYL